MDAEYDFTKSVKDSQLLDEISTAGLPAPDYINTDGSNLSIFYLNSLTSDQATTLATVVSNHSANANYITLAQQAAAAAQAAAIATLTAYLTNSNTTISNTAKAILIAHMAPALAPGLLATINSQIATALGG